MRYLHLTHFLSLIIVACALTTLTSTASPARAQELTGAFDQALTIGSAADTPGVTPVIATLAGTGSGSSGGSSDDGVMVIGAISMTTGTQSLFLSSFDGVSTGVSLSVPSDAGLLTGADIAADQAGHVYVATRTALIRFDEQGNATVLTASVCEHAGDSPTSLAVTPDGSKGVITCEDNTTFSVDVLFWNGATTTLITSQEGSGNGTGISPDGSTVVFGGPCSSGEMQDCIFEASTATGAVTMFAEPSDGSESLNVPEFVDNGQAVVFEDEDTDTYSVTLDKQALDGALGSQTTVPGTDGDFIVSGVADDDMLVDDSTDGYEVIDAEGNVVQALTVLPEPGIVLQDALAVILPSKVPSASVSCSPQGWSATPVTCTVTATGRNVASVAYRVETSPGAGTFGAWTALASGASFTYATQGQSAVQAQATNDDGETSPAASATAAFDSTPPTVSLGARGGTLWGTVTLSAQAADPAPGSGLAAVTFQLSPAGENAWSTICAATNTTGDQYSCQWDTDAAADGSYELRALATDNAGNAASAAQAVTLAQPTASDVTITGAPPSSSPDTSATVTYTESGTVTSTACALDGGPVPCSASSASLSGLTVGEHVFTVRVTGPAGDNSADVSFTVTAAQRCAPANLIPDPATVQAGQDIDLLGFQMTDTPGSVTIAGASVPVSYWSDTTLGLLVPSSLAPGTYTGTVSCAGAQGTFQLTVTKPTDLPPLAEATAWLTGPLAQTQTYALDGSFSTDPDGRIVSYRWYDARKRLVGRAALITQHLRAATSARYQLVVVSNTGASASASVTVKAPSLPRAHRKPKPRTVHVALSADALFAFDSAALSPAARLTLDHLRSELHGATSIIIAGNTDSIGTAAYNQALGLQRAQAVESVLLAGLHLKHVAVLSYGDTRPVAPNTFDGRDDPAGRALNRRVDVTVTFGS